MGKLKKLIGLTMLWLAVSSCTSAQPPRSSEASVELSDYTLSFVVLDTNKLALTGAMVIDGTGGPVKINQTIFVEDGEITFVGDADQVPVGFRVMELSGKTLIPGIVGTHNHMRLPQGAMLSTSPKLYLACGVTTIQTCGTGNPREEIEIGKSIKRGAQPGPEIVNSGPYFTGAEGKSNFIRFTSEALVQDTIAYWASQGVEWLKVYRNTRPWELEFILNEAHKSGLKVTGHLCATTYREAAEMGIDAIEHGFMHSYDHAGDRTAHTCSGSTGFRSELSIDSEEVRGVQQALIENGVALGSTPAIFEAQAKVSADPRSLEAMAPFHREAYQHRRKRKAELGQDWYFKPEWLVKSMQYDLQFFRQGGLLVAGLDPGLHNIPGYGDQKNYELFIQAGFKPEEAIKVMTANGARLLGRPNIGTIEAGKKANLMVLNGDLAANPDVIREVELVLKDGIGYDPQKLTDAVRGNVGSETDGFLTYFGQKPPELRPEVFAPHLISKPDRHEFGCAFSRDGRHFFFGVEQEGQNAIFESKLIDGVWTAPVQLFEGDGFSYNDPVLSLDDSRLYFISNRPVEDGGGAKDIDIWYAKRTATGWSAPIHTGTTLNTPQNEYYVSFAKAGRMYFSTKVPDGTPYNYDIVFAQSQDGVYEAPSVKLPVTINTDRYEADAFIAPDESYLIFCSIRRGGYGQGDLYISFRGANGEWSSAINMGDAINTSEHELCPFVSRDGRYLFYTSNQDIYWVSTGIIEKLRQEVFPK